MSPRAVLLGALLSAAAALGETLEFTDPAHEPLRGRVQVEFPDYLLVAVDGEGPRFVARGALARIVDEGGVAWEDPAPGTFARLLPGAPRGALTDTTLEVRLIQRGHRPVFDGEGPVFLFPGDRAECEGVARLTLVDGSVLTLGAESRVRVAATLELERGEARLLAGPAGATVDLGGGREVRAAAGSVALARSGAAAHLYLERGVGAWGLGARTVLLRAGQGAEALALPAGVRVSADPTNAGPALDLQGLSARGLAPGCSRGPDGAGPGWALAEVEGQVEVRRGPLEAYRALARVDLDRVRLGPGDAVRVGSRGGVALVRSSRLGLGPETTVELSQPLSLVQGELALSVPQPAALAFGPRWAAVQGAGHLRRTGDVWQLEAGAEGLTWTAAGGPALSLESGRLLTLRAGDAGWSLEGPGLVLGEPGGWSAVLPEYVPLELSSDAAQVELTCVGRRRWTVARDVQVQITSEGVAALPGGARLRLEVEGVAAVESAQVADGGSAARVTLASGGRLVVAGSVRGTLEAAALVDARTRLVVGPEQVLEVRAGQGQAGVALAVRDGDRLDLPAGEVGLSREADAWVLRAGERALWIADDAPPVVARVSSALGDWVVEPRGLRALRYPAGAGGRVTVGRAQVRWSP